MKTWLIILASALIGGSVIWYAGGDTDDAPPHPAAVLRQPAILQTVPATQPAVVPAAPAPPQVVQRGDNTVYRYSGPYTHANLTIYLAHGEDTLQGTFLTLQEALEQKKAVVYETGNVNELAIENLSPQEEIFVQAGDIVKGGRQDRVIATDFIVPRRSGRMPIGSFCVEHGRWSQRGQEASAHFSSSTEQAPGKSLKLAAKQRAAQSEVWKEVAANQTKLAQSLNSEVKSRESESSFVLTLENKVVRETADDYIKALSGVTSGFSDTIGFVFAINGQANNADIYGNHELFVKLWPKLLKSAAIEAIAERDRNRNYSPVPVEEARKLVEERESVAPKEKAVSPRVKVLTKERNESILFETSDGERNGTSVHKNYIKK